MERKDFLLTGGLGVVALSAFPFSIHNPKKYRSLKLGVIGTGIRGNGLINISKTIPDFEVTACCDVLPFRLEDTAKKHSIKSAFKDYRKLLDQKEIDAVIIATTFNTHAQVAADALDAGKHVFCEKTLVKGYDQIKALAQKQKDSGHLMFQTGHQYHSSRLYHYLIDEIKSGKIGKVVSIDCQWNRNGDWRRKVPDEKYEKQINWRMYREYSGGLLAELSSHQIDFCNWLLGETPESAIGTGGVDYWNDGRETYDNIHVVYTYPSGIRASFTCLTANALHGYEIKVLGDEGSITIGQNKAWIRYEKDIYKTNEEVDGVSGATAQWNERLGIPIEIEHTEPTLQALIDFKDSILENREPLSGFSTGAKTAACIQMGLDAMYNNKKVHWNKDLESLL